MRPYRGANLEKRRAWERAYYETHKDRIKLLTKVRKEANPGYMSSYNKARKKVDPLYKASKNLRCRLASALKRKAWLKTTKFSNYIGCTSTELKIHLEKQFQSGMTWDNHSLHGWHIDHIVPLESATTIEELYQLCHYTNLQPLWSQKNWAKSDKIQVDSNPNYVL